STLLRLLGLNDYRGVTLDIIQLLRSMKKETNFSNAVSSLRKILFEQLTRQVSEGGMTHFVDIDWLSNNELAVHIPTVLATREAEIGSVSIKKRNGVYDLRPLWVTAYGFELLTARGMGLETDTEGLKNIQKSLDQVDMRVRIAESKKSIRWPRDLSSGMREYIFSLASSVKVNGFEFPRNLHYSDDLMWIKRELAGFRLGVTELFAHELGTTRFVRLRPVGKIVQAGRSIGTLETSRWTGPIKTPISGKIEEINEDLRMNPALLTEDPYDNGWVAVVDPASLLAELRNMHSGSNLVSWASRVTRDRLHSN
ncbi:MAG: glycine cleavage system protein H, partial [Candidatus Thorarchaeota archaeon]